VGELSGLVQEDILDDEEIEVFEFLLYLVPVGIGQHGVLSHDKEGLHFPLPDSLHHLHQGQADPGREGDTPGLLEFLSNRLVVDPLISRKVIGQPAHVAGALHIVLTRRGLTPEEGFPIWPETMARFARANTLFVPAACCVIPMA